MVVSKEVKQKIQLVDGKFTPSEASDVIEALIREKINFHKIQRLKLWTGNDCCDTDSLDGRRGELILEKKIAKDFIAEARRGGHNLVINGTLEISFTE